MLVVESLLNSKHFISLFTQKFSCLISKNSIEKGVETMGGKYKAILNVKNLKFKDITHCVCVEYAKQNSS